MAVEQQSPEWLKLRCGMITGSRIKDVLAYKKRAKNGEQPEEMQCRADYRMDLVAGRLTGLSPERFVNNAMKWGTDHESEARAMYELRMDCMVDQVGFALHPELDFTGSSPDGLTDGVLEIKCPETTTHLEWLLAGIVPEEHRPQMTWEMVCCEATWGHFVSYDPRLPEELQLFVIEYRLDAEYADAIRREVVKFNAEIEGTIQRLRDAARGRGAAA